MCDTLIDNLSRNAILAVMVKIKVLYLTPLSKSPLRVHDIEIGVEVFGIEEVTEKVLADSVAAHVGERVIITSCKPLHGSEREEIMFNNPLNTKTRKKVTALREKAALI